MGCTLLGVALAFALAGSGRSQGYAPLQQAIDRAMAGRAGAVAVVDVESGRLLAQHRLDVAARRLAAPGSAIKPFTLAALLQAGAIEPRTKMMCPVRLRLAGRKLDCSHPRLAAPLDAAAALAWSCNNYFARFGERLTDEALTRAFERAGLTSPSGFAESEASGRVESGVDGEQRGVKAVGAAHLEVTPLALLAAYRRLARMKAEGTAPPELAAVFAGLEGSAAFGMGRGAQPGGIRVAGKTGTAGAEEGHWTHAWFAGYAPAERPEIVLVVFLEAGRGGLDAAPVARELFAAYRDARK